MCLELLAQKLMFCVSLSVFLRGNMLRSSAHKMKKKAFQILYNKKQLSFQRAKIQKPAEPGVNQVLFGQEIDHL